MRKTIKKLTAVGLTLTSVMGLVACGNNCRLGKRRKARTFHSYG
jgi:hypothetical protein